MRFLCFDLLGLNLGILQDFLIWDVYLLVATCDLWLGHLLRLGVLWHLCLLRGKYLTWRYFFYLAVYWCTLDCRCLLISQLFHLLLCLLFKHFCFDDRVVGSVSLRDGILHLWSWFACFRIPLGSCFLHWLRNFLLGWTCRLFLRGGYSFDLRFFGDCRIRSFRFFLLIFVLFYFLL